MPAAAKPFTMICGADDFLVGRAGRDHFDSLAADVTDEFSREVISGFATNVAEVEAAVNRFRESIQTISMFGDRRVVWLKDVNFLADTVTGRAESTLAQVESLQQLLATNDPAQVAILITAAPVDRRRAFPKWCEKNGDFTLIGGGDSAEGLAGVVLAEARDLGITIEPDAVNLLLAKIGQNTRLLIEEVRKLSTYVEVGAPITEAEDVDVQVRAVFAGRRSQWHVKRVRGRGVEVVWRWSRGSILIADVGGWLVSACHLIGLFVSLSLFVPCI